MSFVKFIFVLLILVPVALIMKAIVSSLIGECNSLIKKKKSKK
ncbi:MAG: hypothetical protein PUI91_03215 [Firmicutes bacterium]|nr:hypothetical protein [Bacillota bacterium]MDY2920997.1 hypothetical protein [Lentihominibacter sp.]